MTIPQHPPSSPGPASGGDGSVMIEKLEELAAAYGNRFVLEPAPDNELPEHGMRAVDAMRLIGEELVLDGIPQRNLATFVTTWMEPEAQRIIAENLHPFTVYRGAAMITTHDLASTPRSVAGQCGDARLSSFGPLRCPSGGWCSTSTISTRAPGSVGVGRQAARGEHVGTNSSSRGMPLAPEPHMRRARAPPRGVLLPDRGCG